MKIVVARGPGQYGGIFRRFRALAAYCDQRHEMIGLLPCGDQDGVLDDPVRTYVFSLRPAAIDLMRATEIDEVLAACDAAIDAIARRLASLAPDRVMATDTDLKGLLVIEACRRLGLSVTTHVSSVAHVDAAFAGRPSQRYMEAVERFCLTKSSRLIFPSAFAAQECGVRVSDMAPWTVVYNGIAPEFLDPSPVSRDSTLVGAVTRLSPIKNPETLGRIAAALPRHGLRLEVVASAQGARKFPMLEQHARLLAPTLDNARLASFYGRCRAIVSPSQFEASGNVPMEALATGTPPVVTTRMGVAEILRSFGRDDLVVAPNDVDAAVRSLLEAAPVDAALRATLRREFAWPVVCQRLIAAL